MRKKLYIYPLVFFSIMAMWGVYLDKVFVSRALEISKILGDSEIVAKSGHLVEKLSLFHGSIQEKSFLRRASIFDLSRTMLSQFPNDGIDKFDFSYPTSGPTVTRLIPFKYNVAFLVGEELEGSEVYIFLLQFYDEESVDNAFLFLFLTLLVFTACPISSSQCNFCSIQNLIRSLPVKTLHRALI